MVQGPAYVSRWQQTLASDADFAVRLDPRVGGHENLYWPLRPGNVWSSLITGEEALRGHCMKLWRWSPSYRDSSMLVMSGRWGICWGKLQASSGVSPRERLPVPSGELDHCVRLSTVMIYHAIRACPVDFSPFYLKHTDSTMWSFSSVHLVQALKTVSLHGPEFSSQPDHASLAAQNFLTILLCKA